MSDLYEYEDEINIKDLFLFILKKYKVIIISILIGLVAGSVFSFVKTNEKKPENVLLKIESAEKENLNTDKVMQYANTVKLYKSVMNAENDSILSKMDANNVYNGKLEYTIYSDSKHINSVLTYFSSFLDRDNKWHELSEILNNEYSINNLKEAVSINYETAGNTSSIDNLNINSGTLTVDIISINEEVCNKIVNYISEGIDEVANSLKDEFNFSIINTKNIVFYGFDSKVFEYQRNENNIKQSLLTSINSLEAELTEEEELYYNYYYNYDEFFNNNSKFSFKWPIVFAIAFAIITIIIYGIIYATDGRIKNEEEIINRYRIPLLGIVSFESKKYMGIDKWINNISAPKYNDVNYVENYISSLNYEKLLFSCPCDELKENLKSNKLITFGTLDQDNNAIKEINSYDAVVMTAVIGETEKESFDRQIEIARCLNKPIAGFISVR